VAAPGPNATLPAVSREAARARYDGWGGATLGWDGTGFAAATRLVTPDGDIAAADLRAGDAVLTAAGPVPVAAVTRTVFAAAGLAWQPERCGIEIAAGALDGTLPRAALRVGPRQAIAVNGVAVPAERLVNGATIRRLADDDGAVWFGVALADGAALLAEGWPCPTGRAAADDDRPEPAAALARAHLRLTRLAGLRPGALQGHVDHADRRGLIGWACDGASPQAAVALELVIDGTVQAVLLADRPRRDLEAFAPGGRCGFVLRLPTPLDARAHHLLVLRRLADGATLPGTPVLVDAVAADAVANLAYALEMATPAAPDGGAFADFLARCIDAAVQARAEQPASGTDHGATPER
jgi:hypothetical protein